MSRPCHRAARIASFVLGLAALPAHAAECQDIRPTSGFAGFQGIRRSGCYRVVASYDQRQFFSFALGGRVSNGASSLIYLDAPDIELDLGGHTLSSSRGISGVELLRLQSNQRLVIRNGSISVDDADGNRSGPAVIAPESPIANVHLLRNYAPVPPTFDHVEFLLENLHLKVGGIGVLLMGDGITIRHCTIEVEGENAIVIYGPHAVIEDNRIVYRHNNANPTLVTATYAPTPGHYPQVPAAIYLRAAEGAVVRNNTIEVAGPVAATGVALVDSPNARLEGNRFDRAATPYRLVGASEGLRFTGNRTLGGFLRAEAPLADAAPAAASAPASEASR